MSTAMEIIEKASRENLAIEIMVSGSKEMGDRPHILLRYKDFKHGDAVQETAHNDEEIVVEVDLRESFNKVAYVNCGKKSIKVMVNTVGSTSSVKNGKPAYAFLSKHVYKPHVELGLFGESKVPVNFQPNDNHHGNEW